MSSEMDLSYEFHPDGTMSDLTLVVGDQKILVSKTVLSLASPVFCTMFAEDFQEKSKNEVSLPGKKYEDFVEFLRCIYPSTLQEINENNVYMVLPLAHEYGVEKIVKLCEKVLKLLVTKCYSNNVEQLYRHIILSEIYNQEELREKCICLASESTLQQLKDAKAKSQITDTSYCRILEIALKRLELDREDEKALKIENASWQPDYEQRHFPEVLKCQLKGQVHTNENSLRDNLKALRLTERFRISVDKKDVRATLLKRLKNLSDTTNLTAEFYLLPENIKNAIQNSN